MYIQPFTKKLLSTSQDRQLSYPGLVTHNIHNQNVRPVQSLDGFLLVPLRRGPREREPDPLELMRSSFSSLERYHQLA